MKKLNLILFFWFGLNSLAFAQETERARDLGINFSGTTGKLNAITDVQGVTVGHKTIIKDLENNKAVRTGVTVILPRGEDTMNDSVFGGWFSLNGNGEMTGTSWIEESGFLEGPIALTNTHSVGVVHDALIRWRVAQGSPDATGFWWSLPVVAETYDGYLNDINGFHVKSSDVFEALKNAKAGPVNEGNVGSGTGMTCHAFKCGIGTASRIMEIEETNIIVLIECLTTWLSNLIFHKADVDYNTEKLINFLATNTDATIILVTNDLGESVISANRETREFQKYNGKLNQDTAKICDSVHKVTAGIGIRIK